MPATEPARVPDFLYGTAWKEERTPALTGARPPRGLPRASTPRISGGTTSRRASGEALAAAYRAGIVDARGSLPADEVHLRGRSGPPAALRSDGRLSTQVAQSMASSLEHLGTDYVDSYVLHGPRPAHGWTDEDAEVWAAMVKERDAGRTRLLGVSNVSLRHLAADGGRRGRGSGLRAEPLLRPPRLGSRGPRVLPRAEHRLPGLLLADGQPRGAAHPQGRRASPRACGRRRPRSCSGSRSRSGMLPLTGTSDAEHMREDLASRSLSLSADDVSAIEQLAG